MTEDVTGNDVVALLVEMCALVLWGSWAWRIAPGPAWARVLVVVGVLGAVVALWGLFASPQATVGVFVLEIAVKVLVLGGSVVIAFAIADGPLWPLLWAVVVAVNTTLLYVGPFAR